jgi:succinate dehydrogenase / fumarate reductase, cytochrome b subunit
MAGFVVGHLLGNLQIFLGPEKLNAYAEFLRNTPALMWGTRGAMLVAVSLHVLFTIQLNRRNRASRPISYQQQTVMKATLSSRIMIWSGLLLASYIIYHLLHFTTGTVHPHFQAHDVYANVITGLSSKPAAFFYIAAMISLGLHLHHGIWSMFQTLGLNHPNYNCFRRWIAVGSAALITIGYISIPAAVLLGVLH